MHQQYFFTLNMDIWILFVNYTGTCHVCFVFYPRTALGVLAPPTFPPSPFYVQYI